MKRTSTLLGISLGATLAAALCLAAIRSWGNIPQGVAGNASRGKDLYQGCAACHSIDDNDIGPKHRGVVGRHAASITDYNYSPALTNSGLTWDEQTLDRWLSNPSALVPGTKMYFKIDDPQSRADIIAYLEQLH